MPSAHIASSFFSSACWSAIDGVAQGLAGGDRPLEGHMVARGPLGERAEVGALRRGVRLPPLRLAVRVVAGRVEEAVLFGAGEEVELVQTLLPGPRHTVEALGGAADGRGGPVLDHDGPEPRPRPGSVDRELTQRLGGVEEAVAAPAGQCDRAAADGQPVAAGGQIAGRRGAFRAARGRAAAVSPA